MFFYLLSLVIPTFAGYTLARIELAEYKGRLPWDAALCLAEYTFPLANRYKRRIRTRNRVGLRGEGPSWRCSPMQTKVK